jgi:ribose transport system permease protein
VSEQTDTPIAPAAAATISESSSVSPAPDTSGVSRFRFDPRAFAYRWGLLVAWLIVILVFGALKPDTFLTGSNFSTIFGSQAVLVILSLALLVPLTTGEYDLSIAGTLGIALILTQSLTGDRGWALGPAIVVALLAGLVIGAVNAFFIIKIGVQSLIMTLGMGTLLTGVGYALTASTVVGPSQFLQSAVTNNLLGIPLAFYYGLALTVFAWYVYARTPLGRYLYFVGSGRDVARLSGVKVDTLRAGALLASGFISAFAGVVLGGVLGSSSPSVSSDFLLPAFAAVFLGATAVTPGRFNPWGTFIGVYFLITGITGLELLGLVGWIEQVFYGAALIIAVALSRIAAGRNAVT